jgi:3-oxoisoapionate decarboxylase
MRVGLNPYGLTWVLGLQGRGTARANPAGRGLDGFLAIAGELGAEVVEIFDPWLQALPDAAVSAVGARLAGRGAVPVVSAGIDMMGPIESAFRSAGLLGATTIRLGLTPVLCGDRNAWGEKWGALNARIAAVLAEWGPRAEDAGYRLAIENHQDFTSAELAGFCEAYRGVGITFDTGNTFPVGEAPLDFARRVAPHIVHVHLKDYRVQFTDLGFRLVRCAIGEGAVPLAEMLPMLTAAKTAVLEPGALEARHIRLFTPDWWTGYPPRRAEALAACLLAAHINRLPEDEDYRTPWERQDDGSLEDYELAMIRRSAANMRALGIMQGSEAEWQGN